jgi:hypothetical protein
MSAPERDMIPKIRTWLMIHIVTIQKLGMKERKLELEDDERRRRRRSSTLLL